MRLIHSCLAAAVLSGLGANTYAQVEVEEPTAIDARLSATFRDPVGIVGPADPIEVWVTLTSVGTDAVTFDLSDSVSFGLAESQFPLMGIDRSVRESPVYAPFESYDDISLYVFRSCNDTFSVECSGGPYKFDAAHGTNSWFNIGSTFELASGASIDVRIFTLTPIGGMVAPGTYQAFNMGASLVIQGTAGNGASLEADIFKAGTCEGLQAPGCGFTRTVVAAVPEPASAMMLLGGLGVLGAAVSRRRKRPAGRVGGA